MGIVIMIYIFKCYHFVVIGQYWDDCSGAIVSTSASQQKGRNMVQFGTIEYSR